MHITLTKENADNLLIVSGRLNRSVNEIVNMILESLDHIEMSEEIMLEFKPKKKPTPKQKNIKRFSNWMKSY